MATKIRLKRTGRKGQTTFRLVVTDESNPRDGRPIEELGSFNPHTDELQVDNGRANYWLDQGATPTPRARKLLNWSVDGIPERVTKPKPKKKKVEEVAEETQAEAPAEAAAEEIAEAPVGDEASESSEVEEKPEE